MRGADLERAKAIQKELQEIFRKSVGAWADEATLGRVRRLCFKARMAVNDRDCSERISAIENHSSQLFSARKHRKWDNKQLTGAEYLRLQIINAIDSFGKRLLELEQG